MGFAAIIQLLFSIAPSVIDVMGKLEQSSPQPGLGPQKKNAVIQIVQAASAVAQAMPTVAADVNKITDGAHAQNVDAVAAGVGHMVDHFASLFNALGVFQKAGIVRNAAPMGAQPAVVAPSAMAPGQSD